MNRRNFLKSTLATSAAFSIVPRNVLGGPKYLGPSDQLTRGVIGVGGMGQWHAGFQGSRLLAICDVDQNHLNNTLKKVGNDVTGYHDFRELLERKDIDIVHIATPPHWHAIMSVMAAQAGKDVWCEKPMTRTIGEGQQVVAAMQKYGTIFRINTWFRAQGNFYGMNTSVAPIKKMVHHRMLGWPLKATIGKHQGFEWKFYWSGLTKQTPEWIPEALDYEMWLGPAPYKPYNHHRVHQTFRGYWDYDGGGLGDMGQHYLDPVQYLLEKDDTSPIEVEVDAPKAHPDAVESWRRITYRYADGCEIVLDGEATLEDAPFLEGPEGKLYRGMKSSIENLDKKLAQLPDLPPQETDFIEAVKKRQKFFLNEVNGHRSTTIVNLGKIAVRLGRNLKYDPVKQEFIGDEAANRLIHQPMRGPWTINV